MGVDRLRKMMLDLENVSPISTDTRANQCADLPDWISLANPKPSPISSTSGKN
jgi:hypothetical protein